MAHPLRQIPHRSNTNSKVARQSARFSEGQEQKLDLPVNKSTAHATNLIAEAANLEWIAGQDQTQRFDLPSAKSFATTVCRTCGSPVPRLSRDGQRAVVPAGSLDSTPSVQPTARIFWESRTPWSCAEDELHRFPEAPA